MLAAGIDLGGRTTGTTAIAWVEGSRGSTPRVLEVRAGPELRGDRGDAEVLATLGSPGVVAVDAPLTLPHPIVCTDDNCPVCFPHETVAPPYGSRPGLDSAAAWKAVDHVEKGPMATAMLAGIAFRAIYLARLLRRAGLEVIEVWPMGAYRALARAPGVHARGTDGGDEWRRALLVPRVEGIGDAIRRGENAERDRLDAVAAAYVGWLWLAGEARSVPPGAKRDGEAIWIP
jgi:predicted nuclease with RNAse H fold